MSNPRLLFLMILLLLAGIVSLVRTSSGAERGVEGAWGIQRPGEDAPRCAHAPVMVLLDGRYYRLLSNIGTSRGRRHHLMARSTYEQRGDRVIVQPSFGGGAGEMPRQEFVLQYQGGRSLIQQGREPVTYRPCPAVDPSYLPNW